MTGFLFNASSQIQPQSIGLSLLSPTLALPSTYLADGANFLKKDGTVALSGSLNFGNNKATNMAPGTNPTDGVNLSQLQAIANGFQLHFARVVGVTNINTLSGLLTIDGVTLSPNDIVLLTGQTTASQNGLWVVQSGSWIRPPSWSSGAVITEGQYFIIDPDGQNYANTKWFMKNTNTVTVDTTNVTFQQDQNGMTYTNGSGLSLSGSTFSVARGNGVGLDGSNNITVTSDPNRLLQTVAAGVGIKDGSPGQIIIANSAGNASYQTPTGDVSVTAAGLFKVDNTAGSGFVKYGNFVPAETPGNTPNGTQTTFTLAHTPQFLLLFKNGQLQKPGTGNDYTYSGTNITMLTAPVATDQLLAVYLW